MPNMLVIVLQPAPHKCKASKQWGGPAESRSHFPAKLLATILLASSAKLPGRLSPSE
jgi:hypothetical protein